MSDGPDLLFEMDYIYYFKWTKVTISNDYIGLRDLVRADNGACKNPQKSAL